MLLPAGRRCVRRSSPTIVGRVRISCTTYVYDLQDGHRRTIRQEHSAIGIVPSRNRTGDFHAHDRPRAFVRATALAATFVTMMTASAVALAQSTPAGTWHTIDDATGKRAA